MQKLLLRGKRLSDDFTGTNDVVSDFIKKMKLYDENNMLHLSNSTIDESKRSKGEVLIR